MNPGDFLAIRKLYGETQEEFGRRLGFEGARARIERRVRRYEKGETPIVGTMTALLELLKDRKPARKKRI